jgi:ubiquinone/menaquinone biosynthesis C-methylase UbiE
MSALSAAPKRASIDELRLAPGEAALDVGCGLGDEVRLLAEVVGPAGRAVGLESSEELVAEAQARTAPDMPVEFVVGDAHAMPFTDGEFAGARVERGLQHMEDPAVVVSEMARVVRPGGRIVAMEPDWDTLTITGDDLSLTRAVVRACADRIRHPDAGRRLADWFVSAGVAVERVDAMALPIRSLAVAERVFALEGAAESLDSDAAREWFADLFEQERRGTFLAVATGLGAVGVVGG